MTLINKIIRIYRVGHNKAHYYFIDIDVLEDAVYHLFSFLLTVLKDAKFKKTVKENTRKRGMEDLTMAIGALQSATEERKVLKKMVFFDKAIHCIHRAWMFEGEMYKLHVAVKTRHRSGWDKDEKED